MAQVPPKEGSPKSSNQEDTNAAQNPENIPEAEEVRAPQDPIDSIHQPGVASPSKEHINLGSETGADTTKEGDTEASSQSGTPDQPKREWKTEKKRREE